MKMLNALKHLLSENNKSVGCVLVVGAGSGTCLNELLDLEPESIILIEANRQLANTLRNKTKKIPNVSIVNEWLSPCNDLIETFQFSNPRYNSISAPADKLLAKKNLKLVEKSKEKGLYFPNLLEKIHFPKDRINILYFSVPGAEASLIESINSYIVCFQYIYLDLRKSLLYQDSFGVSCVIPGFNLTQFDFDGEVINSLIFTQSKFDEIDFDGKANLINAELDSSKDKLLEIQSEMDVLKSEFAKSQSLIVHLEEEIDRKKSEIEVLLQQNAKEKESLNAKVAKISEDFLQQSSILKSTSKLNLKLQVDLDNLRLKYSLKIKKEEELSKLITELYVKLKLASEIYYKLEDKYPDIVGELNE